MVDNLNEKLEEIIEEKVEERVQEELEKRDVKNSADNEPKRNRSEHKEVSRRSFLKKLGAGALGIGAMSLSPASALNVRSNDFSVYAGNDSTKEFQVNSGGPIEIQNANLDMNENNITGVEKTTFSNSGNDFWRINDGSGGSNTSPHTARFDDRDIRFYAGTGVGTVWRLNQDGSVEYPEGPVTINSNTVATRNWATSNNISHGDLSNAPSNAHHSRYTDNEVLSVVSDSSNDVNIGVQDTRDTNNAPTDYDKEVSFDFKRRSTVGVPGSGNYSGMLTFAPWSGSSGDNSHQLNFNNGGIFWRQGDPDSSSWNSWYQIATQNWANNNFNNYTDADARDAMYFQPNSAGGTVTAITMESNTNSGSDYGYIRYHDDYYGSGEGSAVEIKAINDSIGGAGPDSVLLNAAGLVDTRPSQAVSIPVYSTESDLPNAPEGSIAYVSGTGSLYVEDGS